VQLYVQVRILDMIECADIQDLIIRKTVQQVLMGTSMEVTIIDAVEAPVVCDTLISMEYSSSWQCATAANLRGVTVSGGIIISSNSTCLVSNGNECFVELSSSDVKVFYDMFGILTAQVFSLGYYFRHTVNFCGLDADQLANIISLESLDFFGKYLD